MRLPSAIIGARACSTTGMHVCQPLRLAGRPPAASQAVIGWNSYYLWALTYGMGPPDPVVNGVLRTPDGATALTQKATP